MLLLLIVAVALRKAGQLDADLVLQLKLISRLKKKQTNVYFVQNCKPEQNN